MKVLVSELTGPALDWAIEVARGTHWSANGYFVFKDRSVFARAAFQYSTDWAHGGPIIDLFKPDHMDFREFDSAGHQYVVFKTTEIAHTWMSGPNWLIAAMRCFVVSKLGEEVDVPEELLT
jgi:hypothetical protein